VEGSRSNAGELRSDVVDDVKIAVRSVVILHHIDIADAGVVPLNRQRQPGPGEAGTRTPRNLEYDAVIGTSDQQASGATAEAMMAMH
jgi:hypothetical protein